MSKVLQSFVSTKSVKLLDGVKAQPIEVKPSYPSPVKLNKKMKRANSEQVVQLAKRDDTATRN